MSKNDQGTMCGGGGRNSFDVRGWGSESLNYFFLEKRVVRQIREPSFYRKQVKLNGSFSNFHAFKFHI